VILLWLAPTGYKLDWWHFRTGFGFLRWAVYIGGAGLLVSLIGVALTWPGMGRPGFPFAVAGAVVALLVAAMPLNQYRIVMSLPFIHDITTDTENPPKFVALVDARSQPNVENGVDYGGPEVAAQQKEAYPDIVPAQYVQTKDEVFSQAVAVAKGMGWEIAAEVPAEGRIEATDTTFWFAFKDDIIIRIADDPNGGTRVDVRSVSRVGRSDVGANAKRIRAFMTRLHGRLGARA
jgi:uncharacterized protein (DUF1499 family)